MHEARLEGVKARTNHQLMKNKGLARQVLCVEKSDFEQRKLDRMYRERYEQECEEAQRKRQQRAARQQKKGLEEGEANPTD